MSDARGVSRTMLLAVSLVLGGCMTMPVAGSGKCGDYMLNHDEECDDGAGSATCDWDCTFAACGDGDTNAEANEQCDDSGESVACDSDCTLALCGDRVVNERAREACDEGGMDTTTCNQDCTVRVCGDSYANLAGPEECDDGEDSSACDRDCTFAECGDGHTNAEVNEQCDDSGESAACDSDCTLALCGDRVVNALAREACDEGGVDTIMCDQDCTVRVCGDGYANLAAGEDCDSGGETASCDSDCTLALCGDRVVNPLASEACDEGGVDTTTCDQDCTVPICGDGHANLAVDEDCDSGGESSSCDSDCTLASCGDGVLNAAAGEACDDGNADERDWCLPTCESASCVDGIRNADELWADCGGQCGGCWAAGGQLVAGDAHTCVLMDTGAVRCWGNGADGQLGYGNTESRGDDEARAVSGDVQVGGRVVQLAAGGYHTCALMQTGAVRCWGRASYGQLGYGNTEKIGDSEVPEVAGDVQVGGPVLQLVAGNYHTCALMQTGAVRCWGRGTYGQLGYGNTDKIGDSEVPEAAGDVQVGGRVVQLAAGGYHTCALMETGAVRCWGQGWDGQLGYGDEHLIGDTEVPAAAGDVQVGGRVVQLAAGNYYTCARMETGAVRCWGEGTSGQLGYGDTESIGDDELPEEAGDVQVGGPVMELAAGHYHACARMETGAVRCWGAGWYGQLGYGNTESIGDSELPEGAGEVVVGGPVVELATGWDHTCVRTETGAVKCWGRGAAGRLGYGDTLNIGDNETPASAGDVPCR